MIKVKPEGREGVYLITKEEALRVVEEYKGEEIHHQFQGGSMIIGADWDKRDVIEIINKSERLAILTAPNMTIGHHLVVIANNERNAFDIGKITIKDLEVLE